LTCRHWRWAFVATFAVVTVGTHLPRTEVLDKAHVSPDKLIHFIAFGVLAMLLVRSRWMPWAAALVLLACWIPFDEWTQSIVSPSRDFEWADISSGWLGVATIGMLCLYLRPPATDTGRSGWARMNACFDAVTQPMLGGALPVLTGATIFFAVLISTYLAFWIGTQRSEATLAMGLALGASMGVTWTMLRGVWMRRDCPSLPTLSAWWWLGALFMLIVGVSLGDQLTAWGLPGQGAPLGLFMLTAMICNGIRPAFCVACKHASTDEESVHG